MKNVDDKLAKDTAIFGQSFVKNCMLKTFPQRIWGAWKVLTGEAGIILVRVSPKDVYKE
jgi:hypothetical protein